MWPDTVEKLHGAPQALPRRTTTWHKRYLPLDGACTKFEADWRLLNGIYLPRSTAAKAAPLKASREREGLFYLVQKTYMNKLPDRRQAAAEFDNPSKRVTQEPLRRIAPHLDPGCIDALCDLIVADAERAYAAYELAAGISPH
jgi:hypothetical protein